jgi:hypothetical protein
MEAKKNPEITSVRCLPVKVRVFAFAELLEIRIIFIFSPNHDSAMTARKIDFYLGTLRLTPEHQRLFNHAEKLTEMQRAFKKIMLPNLGRHCALGGFSEGSLTICADNGAIAAKLRHMLPSLLLKLQAAGYEVTAIRIAVQANYRDIRGNDFTDRRRQIDKEGIKSLNVLAAGLGDSPLKTAVESLLEKQQRRL